jgi:glycosyltransferase involved in cell wall biosynthesis
MKRLSIITVTFNCKRDLERTLLSLQEQTWRDFEHIIVDGNSTDGTVDLIRLHESYIGKWTSEKDNGIYDAMNKGIGMATGEFVQFLNAGDVFAEPESLQRVAEKIESGFDLVFGQIIVTDNAGNEVFRVKPIGFNLETLRDRGTASVNHQSFFLRRSMCPGYSFRYKLKGELDWYLRIVRSHPRILTSSVDHPLIRYQLGGAGNVRYLENLKEWIQITYREFGWIQVFRNLPRYKRFIEYNQRIKKHYRKSDHAGTS